MKPFNPILGETLEGFFIDGSEIFLEHISHHPSISTYLIKDFYGKYKFYG